MFSYCGTEFQMLLDLTGPVDWQKNNIFTAQLKELSKKMAVFSVSNICIEGFEPELSFNYNFDDSVDKMTQIIFETMDTDQLGVLIISNNVGHIKRWVELGFSTVYLMTENCELYTELSYMPDEIWNSTQFYSFVGSTEFRLTYTSEKTGFPNITLPQTNLLKFPSYIHIPDTNLKSDVIFTGRYYKLKDNRNYNHPLSRAIIGFKNNLQSCNLAVKRTLAELIEGYLMLDSSVSYITFVPPRPNKNSRFAGIENFARTDRDLEYDLLFSLNDYPSPKGYHTFQEKYQCVYGNIGCRRKIEGHVLLVDDVFTSGATTAECARVLYEAGASKVTVLPLAFTQNINYQEQSIMPVIFDSEGNENFIGFRNNDSGAYWYSRSENGVYNYRDFHSINKEYLEYHGLWTTKLGWKQEYNDDKEVKAIIFDLDNTLIHTDHLEVYRQRNIGIENLTLNKEHIIIDPSLLWSLKQAGIRIGIVTSSPKNYALRLLSILQYPFDCLVAARDTLRSKPSPDPLLKCALKLMVRPEHVLNIGDQPTDIEAGNNARMMNLEINTIISKNMLEKIIYKKQGLTL